MAPTYPIHGSIDGPIVMIGFGSIGRGTLPLIERHFRYDPRDVHVIEPSDEHARLPPAARHRPHPDGAHARELPGDPRPPVRRSVAGSA